MKLRARDIERRGGRFSDGVIDAVGETANSRDDHFELVKAILVTALYPNVIKIQQPSKNGGPAQNLKLHVHGDEEVFIHPSSVVNYEYIPHLKIVCLIQIY